MPHIIPIRDLKNTSAISSLCHDTGEPIFITKNGYGDLVIMSIERYQKQAYLGDVYACLEAAELQVAEGKINDADDSLKRIRGKYNERKS
jgi:PHD/YefM family antitoxin component YafN of YafNO toxin-antitoxin module